MAVENTAETVLIDVDSTVLTVCAVIVVELVTVVIEIEAVEMEVLVDEVPIVVVCPTCRVPDTGDANSATTPTRNRVSETRNLLPMLLAEPTCKLPY